jgi:putative endonuclease
VSERIYYVYILAKHRHGTLYLDVTNDLIRRLYEHREGLISGFTKHHGIKQLVYFEQHGTALAAIQREKTMKHWSRDWKIRVIEKMNPGWADLYDEICR